MQASEPVNSDPRVAPVTVNSDGTWQAGGHGEYEVEQQPTPLPKLQFSVLLYLQLAEPITSTIIMPFIVKLVEDTGITGGDITKVGYYAGLVESLFFLTESLMILQWGRLSDRIGRRPVLLTGLFGLGISMIFFGLSQTFWAVVASRALAGALNGNTGVFKTMISEITDETNVAQGFAFLPIMWAVGNTIGPLIGGSLQHPYERFGGIFNFGFWERNPYFLPCAAAALYSTSAFVLSYNLLQETAPSVIASKSGRHGRETNYNGLSGTDRGDSDTSSFQANEQSPLILRAKTQSIPLRSLLSKRVLVVIVNYSLLALIDMAFVAIQPLFLSTPIENGGLGMSPSTNGVVLSAFGFASGAICILFFPRLERRFGTRNILFVSIVAFIGCYALYPVMSALARAEGRLGARVWVVLAFQLVLGTFPPMAFSCVFVFLSAAPPNRSALGATNGLAQTTTSIMRALAPAGSTALFALSMEHNLLGGNLVYVVLCILSTCSAAASLMLPARPWKRAED